MHSVAIICWSWLPFFAVNFPSPDTITTLQDRGSGDGQEEINQIDFVVMIQYNGQPIWPVGTIESNESSGQSNMQKFCNWKTRQIIKLRLQLFWRPLEALCGSQFILRTTKSYGWCYFRVLWDSFELNWTREPRILHPVDRSRCLRSMNYSINAERSSASCLWQRAEALCGAIPLDRNCYHPPSSYSSSQEMRSW